MPLIRALQSVYNRNGQAIDALHSVTHLGHLHD